MTLKTYLLDNRAFSLIELVIVLIILSIAIAVGGVGLRPVLDKRKVRNCSYKMISAIQLTRSSSQSEGKRAIFQISGVPKAQDIDGDGTKEYYISFIDANANGIYNSATDKIITNGTPGDELCAKYVSVDPGTTINNRKIIFDPLGFSMNGAANQNIILAGDSTSPHANAARIELVSITGMLRNWVNVDNCGNNGCDLTDNWVELQ